MAGECLAPISPPSLSLTSVYHAACNSPGTTANTQDQLRHADAPTIDRLFRRALSHAKSPTQQWPARRIVRCLHTILAYCTFQDSIVRLKSFRACNKYVLDQLNQTPTLQDNVVHTIQAAARWIYTLVMHCERSAVLADIRQKQGVSHLLAWAVDSPPTRSACLKALLAHPFAPDLVDNDAFWTLASMVLDNYEDDKPTRLLDSLLRFAKSSSAHKSKAVAFAGSVNVVPLVHAWEAACNHFVVAEGPTGKKSLVVLTNVIQLCASLSPQAAHHLATDKVIYAWRSLLVKEMALFTDHYAKESVREDDQSHVLLIKQLARVALSIAYDASATQQTYMDGITRDLLNFMLANVYCSAENCARIGSPDVISRFACDDIYFDSDRIARLFKHESMWVVVLECFMHHVQQASHSFMHQNAVQTALCLVPLATSVPPDAPALAGRLQKLMAFFLHYEEATEVFATSNADLDTLLFVPIIQHVADALESPQYEHKVLAKAHRGLTGLRTVSQHPRARERIVKMGVLDLLSLERVPTDEILDQHPALLQVYTSLIGLVAYLAESMAFVRSRLLEQHEVITVVMRFMAGAMRPTQVPAGWKRVMENCLAVVLAFKFDTSALEQWLSWDPISPAPWRAYFTLRSQRLSVLPAVLSVLIPASGLDFANDRRLITMAIDTFEHFTILRECALQILPNKARVQALSELFVALWRAWPADPNGAQVPQEQTFQEQRQGVSHDETCTNSSGPESVKSPPHSTRFVSQGQTSGYVLYRGLLRMLSANDNTQLVILHNALTHVFEPLVKIQPNAPEARWRETLGKDLYTSLAQFDRLFHFHDDTAIKLRELAAVAVAYACSTEPAQWVHTLGLSSQSIVHNRQSVFGVLCHMLVFDLMVEGNEDENIEFWSRRHSAAQAIQCLAQNALKRLDEDDLAEARIPPRTPPSLARTVQLITRDADQPITADVDALLQSSAYFGALLSGRYAESRSEVILLEDVSQRSLALFCKCAAERTPPTSWPDAVDLLLVADRFGSDSVRSLCEAWIGAQLAHPSRVDATSLDGALLLFRQCRNRTASDAGITSDTWPFQPMLYLSVRALIGRLLDVCETKTFQLMVGQEQDARELSAFCESMAIVLHTSAS
ncbi:hypothetical protein BCR43DRAFT_525674 [Syncephalastrum racemosum]|uniref:BTB domain-containing protein n=1 Tax=Syncephalastrum racemosum TaxID=13706 RepID=A0A1X2H7E8_SYNRA|nr:hypothetical protein BCR43DRAFT_525674 [Syncephalastrum racemosum]